MYKVAILGYRHQAKFHHAPAFAKNPDCEIVAVCDDGSPLAYPGPSAKYVFRND